MNVTIKSDLVSGLRELYRNDEVARRLFDGFASRQKDRRVTPASRAAALAEASHGEIVVLLRKLDELGAGDFKLGRRGSKTRIEWLFSQRGLGQAAQGAAVQPDEIEEINPAELEDGENEGIEGSTAELAAKESEWIAHSFQLRPDVRLMIKLPVNFTSKESERVAGFIRQVPFEE